MKYIVYQVTNKENGKLYIGVHKTENPDIFDGYIGNGIKVGYSLENPKTVYQHALKKYGYSKFIRTTLFVYDNMLDAYNKEREIVTPLFVKLDNNYNTAIGGQIGPLCYKTIYLFTKDGKLISIFDEGQVGIAEYFGISVGKVLYAMYNKKYLYDYCFTYDKESNLSEFSSYSCNDLYLFDFYGNQLAVFSSVKDCANKLNLSFKSLETAVTEKKKYKDCFWTHYPENIFNIIKITKLYNTEYKSVILYDINHQQIKEFITLTKASDELGIKYGTIKAAIRKNLLVDGKYYFAYTCNINKKTSKVGQYNKDTGKLIKIWDTLSECAKIHPKAREVVKGQRNQTHGYTFKYIENN